jgi:hypothetical protein
MTMNTLPRAITAQILNDSETYYSLCAHWGKLIRSPRKHELAAQHHLLYAILLGKDWRKGFTPISNRRKLDNGAYYAWRLFGALAALHLSSTQAELLAPFDGLVTPRMLEQVRKLVPAQNVYAFQPGQFAAGFPFEAYSLPVSLQPADDKTTHA